MFLRNSTDHSSPPNPLCPAPFCTLYTYKVPLHLIRPTQLSTVFRVLPLLDPRPHMGQCLQLQFSLVINPQLLRLLCLDGVRKATKWTQDSLESLTPHGAFLLSHNEINKNCQFYLPCGAIVKIKRMDAYPSLKFAVKPNTNVPYSDLFLHNFISGLTQSLQGFFNRQFFLFPHPMKKGLMQHDSKQEKQGRVLRSLSGRRAWRLARVHRSQSLLPLGLLAINLAPAHLRTADF